MRTRREVLIRLGLGAAAAPAIGRATYAQSLTEPTNSLPAATRSHGLTLGEALKYGPDFHHLDYANPDAPKGGLFRLAAYGGFDSFHPYIIKGEVAEGIGLVFETLATSPNDDIMSEYGLIAETMEVPGDLSYVIYNMRPEAHFHDGTPITADDAVFSLTALREKGAPIYRFYYANIAKAEVLGRHRVKFHFSGPPNRELPQITGQLPVLPRAWWAKRDFATSSMERPLGSGPYRVAAFEPNRYVEYERVKDWWGKDLPINRGRYNFDRIRYDFYRDQVVMLEAFKADRYDFRAENSALRWATQYNFPARQAGKVRVESIPHARPAGMQCFAFNIRRETFSDPKLRWALNHAFDFEWTNKHLFFGQYTRNKSYFANSELAARKPPTPEELALLEPLRGKIPDEAFTHVYEPPATNGSGDVRANLIKAQTILMQAGYGIDGDQLISPITRRPVTIEFLLGSSDFERIIAPFIRNLLRLGVRGRIRTVDSAQYQNRVRDFDYDMVIASFGQSLSPGNEQRNYWSSTTADRPGSQNRIGIKDAAIDALVETIVAAPDRKSLVVATRALDRVLLWNHFVVPNWYIASDRMAWWDRFGIPKVLPKYSVDPYAWWVDPAKNAAAPQAPAGPPQQR